MLALLASAALLGCGGDPPPVIQKPVPNEAPVARATAAPLTGEAPLDVLFDAGGSFDPDGDQLEFFWDFGDGETASRALISYTYAQPGRYIAQLTVTDAGGLSNSQSLVIDALDAPRTPPKAVALTDVTRGVAPLTVEFTAMQSSDEDGELVAYRWLIGEEPGPTTSNFSHTFTEPGVYPVTLEVVDNHGLTDSQTIEITALPEDVRFKVSGTISSLPYTDVDGDINDPLAVVFNNNGFPHGETQQINNPVLLNGFAAQNPTAGPGDVFRFSVDINDIYEVEMEAGQFVSLRVIDHASADLDLYLLTPQYDLVAQSITTGEFESVRIPADGRYFIMVNAVRGASKYLLNVGRSSLAMGPTRFGQSGEFEPDEAIVKFKALAPDAVQPLGRTSLRAQLKVSHPDQRREARVRFNPLNPQTQTVLGMNRPADAIEQTIAQVNPETFQKMQTLKAIKELGLQDDVEFAEPNYRLQSLLTPNDPFYGLQWNLAALNLPSAWDVTVGSADVIVAVVDSGVYGEHVDLQGQLVPGYDFISSPDAARDGDGIDPDPTDPGDSIHVGNSSWHGTHVIGTVVARMNNGEGIAGVASGAKVMPLRALGRGGGLMYDILQSVRFAAGMANDSGTVPAESADIINLSLGGGGFSQASQNLFRQVRDRGIIVIAAAGNDNSSEPMYPASYEGVFSIGATDMLGRRAPYSNTGEFLDLVAPGGNLAVDRNQDNRPDGVLGLSVNETSEGLSSAYVIYQGTSVSAPHVSGVVALMKAVYPGLTPEEFRSLLVSGRLTVDLGEPGRDDEYGYGLIDANLAVNAARDLAGGGTTAAIVASPGAIFFDNAVSESTIRVSAIGNRSISVTSVRSSEAWLRISALEVGERGAGTYLVSVDRTGLEDGGYRAELEFQTDIGSRLQVPVTMQVGESRVSGNAGSLYVILSRADEVQPFAVLHSNGVDGTYEYVFEDVPAGDYTISAGSDINNDEYICEDGETCGFYPTFGETSVIVVNQDRGQIDFAVGLYSTLGLSALNLDRLESLDRGISRRVQPQK